MYNDSMAVSKVEENIILEELEKREEVQKEKGKEIEGRPKQFKERISVL